MLAILAAAGLVATTAGASTVAPGDVAVAKQFSDRVAKGDYAGLKAIVDPGVHTTLLLRNPLKGAFVPGASGTGYADMVRLTQDLLKQVGKPKTIACKDGPLVTCRFDYGDPRRVIAPAFQIQGGKIVKVDYIYLTPEKLREFTSNG